MAASGIAIPIQTANARGFPSPGPSSGYRNLKAIGDAISRRRINFAGPAGTFASSGSAKFAIVWRNLWKTVYLSNLGGKRKPSRANSSTRRAWRPPLGLDCPEVTSERCRSWFGNRFATFISSPLRRSNPSSFRKGGRNAFASVWGPSQSAEKLFSESDLGCPLSPLWSLYKPELPPLFPDHSEARFDSGGIYRDLSTAGGGAGTNAC